MIAMIAMGAAVALLAAALLVCVAAVFRRTRGDAERKARSVTGFLFVSTQIAGIAWVTATYLLAAYQTIALGQPFPAENLSIQAVVTILGNGILKILANIFEHNNGFFWGTSDKGDNQNGK